MILLLLFISFSAQGQSLIDGYSKKKDLIQPSIISSKEADDLFQDLKSLDYVHYNYPKEGCEARATLMARQAEKKKILVAKIYVHGELQAKVPNQNDVYANWDWHVAPVVYVDENGTLVLKVFDPSLFDKPVSQEEWLQAMKAEHAKQKVKPRIDEIYFGSRFQYGTRKKEKQKLSWSATDLHNAKAEMLNQAEQSLGKPLTPEQLKQLREQVGSQP